MFVPEDPDHTFAILPLKLVFPLQQFLRSVLLVGGLNHGLFHDDLTVLIKLGRLEILGPDLL
jgi:hypothetical protein